MYALHNQQKILLQRVLIRQNMNILIVSLTNIEPATPLTVVYGAVNRLFKIEEILFCLLFII